MECVLVTGGSGFIGSSLVSSLKKANVHVRSCVRKEELKEGEFKSPNLSARADWRSLLERVDIVVHTAGRAHVLNETNSNSLELFRQTNVEGSISLARQAKQAKVKRFVFISSLGVVGADSGNKYFNEETSLNPVYDYAVSKLEAEKELIDIFENSATELVIVRPALVYSHSAPGNFRELLKLSQIGLPLPFGGINNKRSLLALENLISFLVECCFNPRAANEIFLIADEEVLSTADIIDSVSVGMRGKNLCFYFPEVIIKSIFTLTGRSKQYAKIFGNLVVSIEKAKNVLNWKPSKSTKEMLGISGIQYKELNG
jgi:UDP-N-acetyl-alpha-D-quinovosamine dehydrogenase